MILAAKTFNGDSNDTLAYQLEKHAARQPDHSFLLYEDRTYSYDQANRLINQHAHAYQKMGVGRGDVVALVMENRPEYLWHMFGLNKLGAAASLINANLTGDALVHAIRICEPKRVLAGSEVWQNIADIRADLSELLGESLDVDMDRDQSVEERRLIEATDWALRLGGASQENPEQSSQSKLTDISAYIYTSGTTGLPKASYIAHHRLYRGGRVWSGAALINQQDDIIYNCLPLYHSNSLIVATGSTVSAGVTMALARKFSRSGFWDDVRRHGATNFIYIGELLRYLLNSDPSDGDKQHSIRSISGNGLRPDIWEEFQSRFAIERIAEFYGATEGNCVTINRDGVVGSVGPMQDGMALARWNEEEEDFVRDSKGFMIPALPGEKSVLLGKVQPKNPFDGYKDSAATKKKVLRDVFESGDTYFNSGDMMKRDSKDNLYFVDRLGDTFRWKGENVSTTEVQEQLSKFSAVDEVNVYGVAVKGTDGRAGMASLVLGAAQQFDVEAFREHVDANLPAYARPVFLRLQVAMETTATLKMKKTDLQKQGFDPKACNDPIYVRHPGRGSFVPIDSQLFNDLSQGQLRL